MVGDVRLMGWGKERGKVGMGERRKGECGGVGVGRCEGWNREKLEKERDVKKVK
jgi:hypothetical protein